MARSKQSGRGTKKERKAQRRAVAQEGRGPTHPSRTDRSFAGTWGRMQGPARGSAKRGGRGRSGGGKRGGGTSLAR